MSFASLTFLAFLPVVFILHWCCRTSRQQNVVLILASYFFYGWWDWRFCFLMLMSTFIDYLVGLGLGATAKPIQRKLLLIASIAANLAVLGIFKYYGFFVHNFQAAMSELGWEVHVVTLHVLLPVGISFYTFQTMSYTIDVFRRKLEPSSNLIDYLAFVSFFPQLVAGPIERAKNLLPVFATMRQFDSTLARSGLVLILYGLAKKLMIADRLAIIVDSVYASPETHSGPMLMLATVCFAFQIYCDFSAYSDIASGVARLFSIRLMRNFDYPYFSRSLSEFWRRWHISLSTWFRDYVYIPLGGSRRSKVRTRANLIITFVLSGLWHGAAWTYLFWGAINGVVLALFATAKTSPEGDRKRALSAWLRGPIDSFKILSTFSVVCLGWIFFRSESLVQAGQILNQIMIDGIYWSAYAETFSSIMADKNFKRTLIILVSFVAIEWCQREKPCPLAMPKSVPTPIRWATYTTIIWGGLYLFPADGTQQFIYFKF